MKSVTINTDSSINDTKLAITFLQQVNLDLCRSSYGSVQFG